MLKMLPFLRLLPLVAFFYSGVLWANTSLGIGVPEPAPMSGGPFFSAFLWIQKYQQYFQKSMAHELVQMSHSPRAALWLVLLSLIYGILHAVGPGHGKAIISSYLIGNDETLKRGLLLAFIASLLQATSAIVLMLVVYFLLPIRWTSAASWLTTASFSIITLLGFFLLVKTTRALLLQLRHKPTVCLGHTQDALDSLHPSSCTCHSHMPLPEQLEHKLSWRTALSLIFSIGLRPCSGALFVMSFALVNKLYKAGIASVFAMGLGTFTTVSVLALLAVKARALAQKLLTQKTKRTPIFLALEWLCAASIFLIGISFVYSSALAPISTDS